MMPFFWIAIAFIAGLLCGRWSVLPLWVWTGLIVLLALVTILGRKYFRQLWLFRTEASGLRVWPVILLQFFALGAMRYALQQPRWTDANLAWYNDRGTYLLTAVVTESPDRREDAVYLRVNAVELYDPSTMLYKRISGKAQIRTTAESEWQIGDKLRFTAAPRTPSENEDFSYRDYLQHYGIYTVIYYPTSVQRVDTRKAGWLAILFDRLRQRASRTIFTIYPQPESGLMAGILLGNDNDLPASIAQAYRDTGTAHIIAISGFNMSILAALCVSVFSRMFGRKSTVLLSSLVLGGYAVFVGASPSVMRALIMAVFAFGGQLIGRHRAGMNSLGLSALLMTVLNPYLPGDASFQLSFAATLGLLLFADPMKAWLSRQLERRFLEATAARLTGPVCEYFLYSLAAQLMTLPVIVLQFHRLSLTSLIANPLVLPVQPAVLVSGMVAVTAGMISPITGKVLGFAAWPLLAWSNRMVEWVAALKWGSLVISDSFAIILAVLSAMLVLLFLLRGYLMKFLAKINWIYVAAALLIAAVLVGSVLLHQPDGRLHLSLLRAGDGTAIFLRSPGGASLLIDPSGSTNELAAAVSRQVSPWNFHVDAVLLTSRAAVKPLGQIVGRLPITQAILTLPAHRQNNGVTPVTLPAGMASRQLDEGEVVQFSDGVEILPLAEDGEHTALLIIYGSTRVLIPGAVKPANLRVQQIDDQGGLTLLILNEQDIANLPADMWENYGAQYILWNSTTLSPDPGWPNLQNSDTINIVSSGEEFSLIRPQAQ